MRRAPLITACLAALVIPLLPQMVGTAHADEATGHGPVRTEFWNYGTSSSFSTGNWGSPLPGGLLTDVNRAPLYVGGEAFVAQLLVSGNLDGDTGSGFGEGGGVRWGGGSIELMVAPRGLPYGVTSQAPSGRVTLGSGTTTGTWTATGILPFRTYTIRLSNPSTTACVWRTDGVQSCTTVAVSVTIDATFVPWTGLVGTFEVSVTPAGAFPVHVPGPVDLQYPDDGAAVNPTAFIVASRHPEPEVVSAEVEVTNIDRSETRLLRGSPATDSWRTSYSVPAPPMRKGTHRWRARMVDVDGDVGPWSGFRTFTAPHENDRLWQVLDAIDGLPDVPPGVPLDVDHDDMSPCTVPVLIQPEFEVHRSPTSGANRSVCVFTRWPLPETQTRVTAGLPS